MMQSVNEEKLAKLTRDPQHRDTASILTKCFKHCQSRIEDVAASIQLRGGAKPPAGGKPKPLPAGTKKLSERQNIETLSEQQVWLRKSIGEVMQKFGEKDAFGKKMLAEMRTALDRIDELLEKTLSSNTFSDSLMSPNLNILAQRTSKLIQKTLGKRFAGVTISPIDHSAADGKSYSTILISFKSVKTDDKKVLPWLVFALSETQERNVEKRLHFVTAMSTPNTTFTPRSPFKDAKQLERQIGMYLTSKGISVQKNANNIPDGLEIGPVAGVSSTNIVNGKMVFELDGSVKPETVALAGMKAIISAMRSVDKDFNGNIQHIIKKNPRGKPTEIIFSSTLKGKDKVTNVPRKSFKLDESSVQENKDTAAAIINIDTLFAQLGRGFTVMTGAKDIVIDKKKNNVQFKIGRNPKKITHVRITLNSQDLYDLEFLKWNSKALDMKLAYSENDVGNSELSKSFFRGTGLHTSLH